MSGIAKRAVVGIGVAVVLLSNSAHLLAQGGDDDSSQGGAVAFGIIAVVAFAVIVSIAVRAYQRKNEKKSKPDLMTSSLGLGERRAPLIDPDAESDSESYPDLRARSAPIVLGLASEAPHEAPAPDTNPPFASTPAAPINAPVMPASVPLARPVVVEPPAPVLAPPIAKPAEPSVKPIFISYRRQDSQHITGRIYDRLYARFGKESVFKDVDSIPLGLDFREHLREQVGRCAVLVAVIGKNWNPPSASGQKRLMDPRDHLRIEIESALDRRVPVIPVLVDGMEMPAEDELPPSLERLAYHNGISVRPDPDFHHDADRLVRGIEQLLK